jgi:carbamoyltransferase
MGKMNKILGINYSGFHDTSIVVVDEQGNILNACSLERVTREKQDGKTPYELLKTIDFSEIERVVISTNKFFEKKEFVSKLHPQKMKIQRDVDFQHKEEFYNFLKKLPISNIDFIDHELAHAASSFWLSGFDEAVCLVYDGGMYNTNIFGGVYKCSKKEGIKLIDGFDINIYSKITTLYTLITATLGFTPNKHEGKITGLAAFGKYNELCTNILNDWFINRYDELESSLEWIFSYNQDVSPIFYKNSKKIALIKESFNAFDKETIAYNLQLFTENHILTIISNMQQNEMLHKNICLAGGLFANVKINQKIADFNDFNFENIFVAPPMGDEGTALGAALQLVHQKNKIIDFNNSMYLGEKYTIKEILNVLDELKVVYEVVNNPSNKIANILASGSEVALFDLRMEFGPRALGARSILAPANDKAINDKLNKKLNRTEFMPFAPMTLEKYLDKSYINFGNKKLAMKFMTIACECTIWMAKNMSAVVHIDNTARPQIITKEDVFLYEMMNLYNDLTGLSSIVNTSFNIHEEPIINTPYEAIKGFLISGLDYLFFKEANVLIKYDDNKDLAFELIKERMLSTKPKEKQYKKIIEYFEERNDFLNEELTEKELVIQELDKYVCSLKEQEVLMAYYKKNIYVRILKKLGLIK